MKIIKRILFVILGFIVVVLIAGLFMRKDYGVSKEVVINKPNAEVFAYVKLIKNQDNFSTWQKADPNMKKDYKGTDGTVGFVAMWDSQNKDVGKGEQEIKAITEGSRIDMELRFIKPFEATDNAYMTTEVVSENQTKVTWGFKGRMAYPMNLMLAVMNMEDMLGEQLGTGLNNLKAELEK
jgi:hypothetical protein